MSPRRKAGTGEPAHADDGRQYRAYDQQRRNRHLAVDELVDYPLLRLYRRDGERRGLRPRTLEKYRSDVAAFGRWMHPASTLTATRDDIEAFLDDRHIGNRTRYTWLSTLEGWFEWLIAEEHHGGPNPLAKIRRPKVRPGLPRPIDRGDLAFAMAGADPQMKAWLALAAWQGLRCAEIAGLARQDVLDTHEPPMLMVVAGKGGKDRLLPLNPDVLAALRVAGLPRYDTDWLFPAYHGGRRSPEAVSQAINHYLRGLGIAATAHQLRHLFGTRIYALTHDLRVTQALLGHESPTTTAIYAAWSPVDAAKAVVALTRGAQ